LSKIYCEDCEWFDGFCDLNLRSNVCINPRFDKSHYVDDNPIKRLWVADLPCVGDKNYPNRNNDCKYYSSKKTLFDVFKNLFKREQHDENN